MAHYTDAPPGYDNVVPPRVFAPLPNSGQRPFLGDDRSLFAPGPPEWLTSRTTLVQTALPLYQQTGLEQQPIVGRALWKQLSASFRRRSQKQPPSEPNWKPFSLRAPFLLVVMLISMILVVFLQLLLLQSQKNGGIIFATNANSLPLKTTFPYLYLPTIIAVVYGFLWNWIDLDVRRIEPFLQLAKKEGATGQESLLLHYPVDFLASVPIKALKQRHWPVFTASIATVIVFWGITPTQAGIFAVDTLNKTVAMPSVRSTAYASLSHQGATLSAQSAHSVANIMWLNETLQPFMTHDYIFAPFGPLNGLNTTMNSGTWSGQTLKYSVDVTCETPIAWTKFNIPMINSTWGCQFPVPTPRAVSDDRNATKIFDTLYVGYFNDDGLADYYLSDGSCPRNETNSFLIQWSKTRDPLAFNGTYAPSAEQQRRNSNTTILYCRSNYHVQEVEAIIRLPNNEILSFKPLGDLQPLPRDIFNTSNFEASMSMGHERFLTRTEFPTANWPDQTVFVENMPINTAYFPKMAPFAIGATQLPLDAYLDPATLGNSYQAAYRLLFSRQLANVLSPTLDADAQGEGHWSYQTQSIVLVPAFTYIVEALLIVATFFAFVIMYNSCARPSKLLSNPATIAATMSLVADDNTLLNKLKGLDQATEEQLRMHIRNRRFRLVPARSSTHCYRIQLLDLRGNETLETINDELLAAQRDQLFGSLRKEDSDKVSKVDAIQPTEFSLRIGLAFLVTQITLFVLIAGLYLRILRSNGLPLPSSNQFVRQLLENYLPTAVGTLIEPFWVVLNRHLCSLQPFEALRKSRAKYQRSIALDYTSLPPQLVIVKALVNKNFLLATICGMTLLANVLAVSLSGLFFENIVELPIKTHFNQSFATKFTAIDGSAPAIAQVRGGTIESFYVATSNQTARTPFPPWTDEKYFYQPFAPFSNSSSNQTSNRRAITRSLGARLKCSPLSAESSFHVSGTGFDELGFPDILSSGNLTVILTREERKVSCVPRRIEQEGRDVRGIFISARPTGPSAYEFTYALDGYRNGSSVDAAFCREHVASGWVRGNLVNGTSPKNLTDSLPSIVTSYESTIIVCQGQVVEGMAETTVSGDGHIMLATEISTGAAPTDAFSTTASDVLGQAHQFILQRGMIWHNDSLPSDFGNYLLGKALNSSRLVNPSLPPPTFEEIAGQFEKLYAKLFAIWLASNRDQLLMSAQDGRIDGFLVQPTTRIFISKPMFIIAETILAMYIIVTVILYLRRPWRILCRMPTSPASIIAFFAASHAVKDMCGTVGMDFRERGKYLSKLNQRYGFGTFIGIDSKTHIGVEKHPFLAPLTKGETGPQGPKWNGSKRALREVWRWKFVQWRSGKVHEGGWM